MISLFFQVEIHLIYKYNKRVNMVINGRNNSERNKTLKINLINNVCERK